MRTHGATRLLALILSLRYVARIQTSLNSCDRSQRQNSHMSHEAICCSDLSRRRVAAICRIVCFGVKRSWKDHLGKYLSWFTLIFAMHCYFTFSCNHIIVRDFQNNFLIVYDRYNDCPAWSAMDECKKSNWTWMVDNCPRSCDVPCKYIVINGKMQALYLISPDYNSTMGKRHYDENSQIALHRHN